MTLVESTGENEEVVEVKGLKFALNSKMSDRLEGAEIDYKNSFFSSGFSITGENQPQSSC